MANKAPLPYPDIQRGVRVKDLTPAEKDQLLEAIIYHLGREVEATKWDGREERDICLHNPRS